MGCNKCNKNNSRKRSSRINETHKIKLPPVKSGCSGVTSYNPPIKNNINRIEKKRPRKRMRIR